MEGGETHENNSDSRPGLGRTEGFLRSSSADTAFLPYLVTKTCARLVTDTCSPSEAQGFSSGVTGATLPWALAQSQFCPPLPPAPR